MVGVGKGATVFAAVAASAGGMSDLVSMYGFLPFIASDTSILQDGGKGNGVISVKAGDAQGRTHPLRPLKFGVFFSHLVVFIIYPLGRELCLKSLHIMKLLARVLTMSIPFF